VYFPKDNWGQAWSVATGKPTRQLRVAHQGWDLPGFPAYHVEGVYGRDGRLFALADWQRFSHGGEAPVAGPNIPISDRATGHRLSSFLVPHAADKSVEEIWSGFTPDSRSLLVVAESEPENGSGPVTGTVFLVEVANGKEQVHVPLPKSMTGAASAAMDNDGRLVVFGDSVGTIRLWDALTNRQLAQFEAGSGIECLCLSPDGNSLASGLANGTALVWDLSEIQQRLHPPDQNLSLPELTDLWAALGAADAHEAYQAIYRLAADPRHAVPFLSEHIVLPAPPVAKRLPQLIADLDAKRFSVREQASKDLAALGARVEPILRQTLASHPSPEVRRRVTDLLAELDRRPLSTEEVRTIRALKVLEMTASPEARRIMRKLAKSDPHGWVARDAAAALSRIKARDRSARESPANQSRAPKPAQIQPAAKPAVQPAFVSFWEKGKWGYMNAAGKVVIRPQYASAQDFSDGLAYVQIRTAQDVDNDTASADAFIDTHGKVVFSPAKVVHSTNWIGACHEGRIAFEHDFKWGYFDKRGTVVIKPHFTDAERFTNGLAAVYVGGRMRSGPILIPEGGHWGFIDKTGRILIPARYEHVDAFSEGLAAVRLGDQLVYIDRKGKEVLHFGLVVGSDRDVYYSGGPFSSGLAWVEALTIIRPHVVKKTGFINNAGKFVIASRFDDARDFSEGRAAVKIGKQWGYIDKTGHVVIRPRFSEALKFHDGLAAVADHGKWSYIDRTGVVVIRGPYNDAGDFENGLAIVHEGGSFARAMDGPGEWRNGSSYYINRTGKKVRLCSRDRN
jgi:hypothetical protein